MTEAFPNAEHLFRQAFAAVDPVPLLLQLVKEHPTYLAVRDLVVYYTGAVEENLSRGNTLASALARLGDCPDAPTFDFYTTTRTDTLCDVINRELADTHFKVIWDNFRVKQYGSKNTYLLESLLSGLSFKYGLTATSDMRKAIEDGLKVPCGSEDYEELVVGTCIQLLLHGSEVTEYAGNYWMQPAQVAKMLIKQKEAGILKDPQAIQVLELAIWHAETGLKPENVRDDVWTLLFPSKP